jgi:hypothetical protein
MQADSADEEENKDFPSPPETISSNVTNIMQNMGLPAGFGGHGGTARGDQKQKKKKKTQIKGHAANLYNHEAKPYVPGSESQVIMFNVCETNLFVV